jgi:hypothetical protein
MAYRIRTRVKSLEEKSKLMGGHKNPDTGMVSIYTEKVGWFVHLEGSYESLFVGKEKPTDLEPGTEVDIIIWPHRRKG